ncbi:MAG: LpqB family beta-propeller domain-containing protein [Isosphaeraceae bacterium]|nr:LpqB family beta-propeller domain-containing protein [Isosphaeraceae bacterium]
MSVILAVLIGLIPPHLGAPPEDPAPVRLTHDGLPKLRPAWSPDGKRLAFARQEEGGSRIRQYVREADGSLRRLTKRGEPEYDAVFAPDGKSLMIVTVKLSGTQGNLDLSTVSAEGGETTAIDVDGGKLAHQEWPAWSPDGSRIAFSSTHEGNQEIYTSKPDGSDRVRVTRSTGIDAHPCWTPDGKRILFATDRWGGLEIASAEPDGTNVVRLTKSPGLDDYPAVSPDGKRVAFVSHRTGDFEVFLMNIDGSDVRNLSDHPARDTLPTWTPDGRRITFVSGRASEADLYERVVEP